MSEFARSELRTFAPGRPSAITIGNFDGVHLGHQFLVRYVMSRAQELGLAAGVVTLYPDPVRVLRPSDPMKYLTSLEERIELLCALGLDFVAPLSFTSEFAELSPRTFVTLLRQELDLKLLIMGPDNTFGRNREATLDGIQAIGHELGFEAERLPQVLLDVQQPVSATAIRNALADGDLPSVETQLGRRYSLRGPVVHGYHRGRELGFPTANIGVTPDRALPSYGIYATWAYVGDKRYASATNVGVRPHFDGEEASVETYIIDFDGDLYEQTLRIEFVSKLRDEAKFESLEGLKEQIGRDVARAREVLSP